MLSNHYADCIGPCQLACPAGVDIQGYIALAALDKHRDAIALIKDRNPLPAVCGRVCTRPCEVSGCRRTLLDEAVGVDYIKRYLSDLDLGDKDPWRPALAPPNGKKVAVVGAGPAGLSCAYYLALRGYEVSMFEAQPEAGGMLRYGIPEYRLPKDVLDLEINQILDLGVQLSTNVQLGRDFTVTSLKQGGYDAIFLGLGAWDSSKMRVQDEDSPGVLAGIEFLKQFGLRRKIDIHGRVLVVGGGNTAIDCARTALRLGVADVRILYRRTRKEMPANEMEIVEAEHEGVKMDFLVAPVRVLRGEDGRVAGVECIRMELGEPDQSGRRSPKPIRGSEFRIDCEFVLAAIGQGTRVQELLDGRVPNFLPLGESLSLTRWQTVQVNERTFETTVDGVFSGGDVVTGAATAIEAIAAGRKAAYAIDRYVATGRAEPEPVEVYSRKDTYHKVQASDLNPGSADGRRSMPALLPADRVLGFAEVETGYSREDLRRETARCLECGCTALFTCDLRRYATEYGADVQTFMGAAGEHPRRPAPPADGPRPEQVHPVRPLRAHLQRAGGGGGLRLHQPRLRHGGQARPGRLPARHRVRELRPVHRHLPHRGHRREAAPGQARSLEDRAGWSRSATTAARAAGWATRSPAAPWCRSRAREATGPAAATTARRGASATATCSRPSACARPCCASGASCRRRTSTRPCATPPCGSRS